MSAPARVFDFQTQKDMSDTDNVHALVEQAIRQRFPELLATHKAHLQNDRRGIDYWLEFPHGVMEKLDVIVRKKDYSPKDPDNICLEVSANTTTGKLGWTTDTDKLTDWVLFLWLDSGKSELVHARQLRAVATENMGAWLETKRTSTQTTGAGERAYSSTSLFIDSRSLWAAFFKWFSYSGSAQKPDADTSINSFRKMTP